MFRTVLIVSDDDGSREQHAWRLRVAGYRVLTATSGREALGTMNARRIDLLVLDLEAPDARATLQRIEGNPRLARVPMLLATASPGSAPPELASIAKPFSPEKLTETVAAIAGTSRAPITTPLRQAAVPRDPGGGGEQQ
jgi:two-component system chemotaxis response regulator CheY